MPLFADSPRSIVGTYDPLKMIYWSHPVKWVTANAVFVGHGTDNVWLFRRMPSAPLFYADGDERNRVGSQWQALLNEVGQTSKNPMGSLQTFSNYRKFHIVVSTIEGTPQVPSSATQDHIDGWLAPVFSELLVPSRACFIGIKLEPGLSAAARNLGSVAQRGMNSLSQGRVRRALQEAKEGLHDLLAENEIDLSPYEDDAALISGIMAKYGAKIPSEREIDQVMAWYNDGMWTDVPFKINPQDHTRVFVERAAGQVDTYEMAALTGFDQLQLSPLSQWIEAAMATEGEASVVSIKGEFEPYEMVRNRLKRSKTRMITDIKQLYQSGQIDEGDEQRLLAEQEAITEHYADTKEPMVHKMSAIFGRKVRGNPTHTYIDILRTNYGIRAKPLEYRQVPAMLHTLPCSTVELAPLAGDTLTQEVSLTMLSHSGLPSFSDLGDSEGLVAGLNMPHYTLCWLDLMRVAAGEAASQAPLIGVFGDPGSGKTWLGQSLAVQAVQEHVPTVFINPKGGAREHGGGTLARMAEALGGRVVNLTDLAQTPGALDPFRFIPDRAVAAQVLTEFINDVLGNVGVQGAGFTNTQTLSLMSQLQQGVASGAKSAVEVLRAVTDPVVSSQIQKAYQGSASFRLAIGNNQHQGAAFAASGFTLIEFGRDLALPEAGTDRASMSIQERIGVAVLRLVSRISLEMLIYSGKGGFFVLDEAYAFMDSQQGRKMMEKLGRQGRSQRVTAALLTHKVADLESLDGYFGRVFVMKLSDRREAVAALRHCGVKATKGKVDSLQDFGPKKGNPATGEPGRAAIAYHKDLDGRVSLVLVTPTPHPWDQLFNTSASRQTQTEAEQIAEQLAI